MPVVREIITLFGLGTDKGSFKDVDSKVGNLKRGISSLARVLATGTVANALRGIATETAQIGDAIDKTSGKLGIATDALQELRFAAELTGVAQNTTDMALQRFGRRAAEAARGTGEAKDALKELGVQLKDNQGRLRPTDELLGDVAEGLKNVKGQGDRVRLAFKLFDSEGVAFVNTLQGGKEELEAMRQEARDLGGVLDQDLIKASVDYTDTMARMGQVTRGLKNIIARDLLPFLTESAKATIEWLKANRQLIADRVMMGIRTAINWLKALAEVAMTVADGFRAIGEWAGPVAKSLIGMVAVLTALVLLFGTTGVAVLILIAVFEDLIKFFKGENSLLGLWLEWITQLKRDMLESPINPDDVWFVKIIQTTLKLLDRLKGVGGIIGRFLTGGTRGLQSAVLEQQAQQAGASPQLVEFLKQQLPGVLGASEARLEAGGLPMFGPGATAGATTNVANNPTVNQTINVGESSDPDQVRQAARRGTNEALADASRRTIRQLVLQARGGGFGR